MLKFTLIIFIFLNFFECFGNNAREDLIELKSSENLVFDIRYATTNNFFGKQLYVKPRVFIHKDMQINFNCALKRATKFGYKIKIFDAWRPYEAQQLLWSQKSDPNYVSHPETGPCGHCRGMALDLTLVNAKTDIELDMGTDFDNFTEKAHHDTDLISDKQLQNRIILSGLMSSCGFVAMRTEWWHYTHPDNRKKQKYTSEGLMQIYNIKNIN